MKKVLFFCTLVWLLLRGMSVFAQDNSANSQSTQSESVTSVSEVLEGITFPEGKDFERLKQILVENFDTNSYSNYGSSILKGALSPNYSYTNIDELALKLIIEKNFEGNEELFSTIFPVRSYERDKKITKEGTIKRVPRVYGPSDIQTLISLFGSDKHTTLLHETTFNMDYSKKEYSSLLKSISTVIKRKHYESCTENSSKNDCGTQWKPKWNRKFLPTLEELGEETLFLNRKEQKISDFQDSFTYTILEQKEGVKAKFIFDISKIENENLERELLYVKAWKGGDSWDFSGFSPEEMQVLYPDGNVNLTLTKKIPVTSELKDSVKYISIQSFKINKDKTNKNISEIEARIEKKLVKYRNPVSEKSGKDLSTSRELLEHFLVAVREYKNTYTQEEKDIFELRFKNTTFTLDEAQEEIKKLEAQGSIESSGLGFTTVDYEAKIADQKVPTISKVFDFIPNTAAVLYIKNPQNIKKLLDRENKNMLDIYGFDFKNTIQTFAKQLFDVDNFEEIQEKLSGEFAIAVLNIDITAPEFVLIISEADEHVLNPTSQARVVAKKDGYIFIASTEKTLQKCTEGSIESKLSHSGDFRYVWLKKGETVKDIFLFVGDHFVEKMISLENFVQMSRKTHEMNDLFRAQLYVWSYEEAFGTIPKTFDDMPVKTEEIREEYNTLFQIEDNGIVRSNKLGTISKLKTLENINYDINSISRDELYSYYQEVYGYKEVWTDSLDPIGIVINLEEGEVMIDFFMTPIPNFPDKELAFLKNLFQSITKEKLEFVENKKLRKGIASIGFGFDPKKLEKKIIEKTEKSSRQEQVQLYYNDVFSQIEIGYLDDESIFDYLGGEFFFSLGSIDPDIFEGWNVEKVDAYISISFENQQKAKKLVNLIFTDILSDMGKGGMERQFAQLLAKPLIEEYSGEKIYYVENIPFPFVGNLGFAYTYVDNFFVIGLNRTTIKKVIDTAQNPIETNNAIISNQEPGTFFTTVVNGEALTKNIKTVYAEHPELLKEYLTHDERIIREIVKLLTNYEHTQEYLQKIGAQKDISHTYGILKLSSEGGEGYIGLDSNIVSSISDEVFEKTGFDKPLKEELSAMEKLSFTEALKNKELLAKMVKVMLLYQVETLNDTDVPFVPNMYFSASINEDEIGVKLTSYTKENSKDVKNNSLLFSGIGGIILFVLGGGLLLQRRKHKEIKKTDF